MLRGPIPDLRHPRAAVLVPVKAFGAAKRRLAGRLDPATRADLARAMAARVLAAAVPLPVAVVCDDEEVRTWAEAHGAEPVWTPGLGLNRAVETGIEHLGRCGIERIVVAHADLPLATELGWIAGFDGVSLVPDRHGDGTNVVCVPAGAAFRFAYGAGSARAHREEAARCGLAVRVIPDRRLGWDLDLPSDLVLPDDLAFPEEIAAVLAAHPLEAPCP